MKLAVVALTAGGSRLAVETGAGLVKEGYRVDIYLPRKFAEAGENIAEGAELKLYNHPLRELMGEIFAQYQGLILIMALGIVVRLLAPCLEDKRTDPAVVVVDERGEHAVSVLSGHLGGANRLTEVVAGLISARPVITTATDVRERPAFDLLAGELDFEPVPFSALKTANTALVNDEDIIIYSAYPPRQFQERVLAKTGYRLEEPQIKVLSIESLSKDSDQPPVPGADGDSEATGKQEAKFPVYITNRSLNIKGNYLQLVPKNIIIGLGSRKGVSCQQVEAAVRQVLNRLKLHQESLKKVATIDLKAEEKGIREFTRQWKLPLEIIDREAIKKCDYNYNQSEFVREKIGVGGVCEPAALLAAEKGKLIAAKTARKGVTVAVVEDSFI